MAVKIQTREAVCTTVQSVDLSYKPQLVVRRLITRLRCTGDALVLFAV